MRSHWLAAVVIAAAVGMVVMIGCSGAGERVAAIEDAAIQDLAADHVSSVVLLRSWLNVLYEQLAKAGDCEMELHWEIVDQVNSHYWGVNTDCSQFDWVQFPDGSGEGLLLTPDGQESSYTWGVSHTENGATTVAITEGFPDDTRLEYQYTFSNYGTVQTRDGTATLADGRSMQFSERRDENTVRDDLQLALPDGSRLEVSVPFIYRPGDRPLPDFSTGARGLFVGADGAQLDFDVIGSGAESQQWHFTGPDGTEGTFTLAAGLAGTGTIMRGRDLAAAFRWQGSGDGTLDLVGAGSAEVTPSAAARDFQVDRWVRDLAAMGPAPMY